MRLNRWQKLAFKMAGLGSIGIAQPVAGFVRPNPAGGCSYTGEGTVEYFLSNTGAIWTPAQIADFNFGANQWEGLRGEGAVAGAAAPILINVNRLMVEPAVYQPNQFRVTLTDHPSGATNCEVGPQTIEIKATAVDDEMRYLAAHEVGHALGLRHTDRYSNLTNGAGVFGPQGFAPYPVMSECFRPTGLGYFIPKVDDWASLAHKRSGSFAASPNGGFESSLALWATSGSFTRDNAVSYRGQWSGRLDGASNVRQRVRIITPADHYGFNLRYKTNSATARYKGNVHVAQRIGCATDTTFYPAGSNWVTLADRPLPAAATWSAASWSNTMAAAMVDVEIIVTNSTSATSLWIDNVRTVN